MAVQMRMTLTLRVVDVENGEISGNSERKE